MVYRLILLLLLSTNSLITYGQYKFSDDPASFQEDVTKALTASGKPDAVTTASNFSAIFGQYSNDLQKKIIETTQGMTKTKMFRSYPHYNDYFAFLTSAKQNNIESGSIDTFLIITKEYLTKWQSKEYQLFFSTCRNVAETNYIYKSRYNSLKIAGGSFKIRMATAVVAEEEYDEIIEETPIEETEDVIEDEIDYFSDWDVPIEEDNGFGTIEDNTEENFEEDVLDVGYSYPFQPTVSGPVIEFTGVDMSFITPQEEAILKNTTIYVVFESGLIVGKGGKMDWSISGMPEGEVEAEMREFNFPIISTKLTSEGALLTYKSKIDEPVEGIFEYKENKNKDKIAAQYPRFKSFKSNINVKGFDDNIEYYGGFSMAGKRIYSSSIDEGFSTIIIKNDSNKVIKTLSNKFELQDTSILSSFATFSLYIGEDSITHPGVTIDFNKNSRLLKVAKHPGFNFAPFIDSYHQIEITTDVIHWNLNDTTIDFNIINAKNHIPATFESNEFFNPTKFSKLRGIYRFHPLQLIVYHATKNNTNRFYSGEVAEAHNIDPFTFKGAMTQMMKLGFIDYNTRTGLIVLRPKAHHYVLSARKKKDFDNIIFSSLSPNQINASLNVNNYDFLVRGVDRIFISDSLRVNLEPENKEIKIQKNRNFTYSGYINTQNFRFIGKDFNFVYDSFLVHMPVIDEIKLAVTKHKKKNDAGKSRVLGNELKYSSGTLFINKPDNKSATKSFPEYPIFDATSGATVYFNKDDINKGAYDTSVKFEIPPFRLDSLSSEDPHAIGFDGTFKSGGIFPEFKEKLIVMEDYSLGFEHRVPENGYQLYEGSARYYDTISLDQRGVRGTGYIKYLTTTLYSHNFNFYQDSVKTKGYQMNTDPGSHVDAHPNVHFPKMVGKAYRLLWLPKQDSMMVSSTKDRLVFYEDSSTMIGTSIITRKGMLGKGVFFTKGSISESWKLEFHETRFGGREAKFRIESDDPDVPALLGLNVYLKFDLENNIAQFGPEIEGDAACSFPYVKYKTSLQNGVWDLKNETVKFEKDTSTNEESSYFYSTRKDQDSLVFFAGKGMYSIPRQELDVFEIPYIKVADAKIFPDSNTVTIEENAVMTTLRKAVIEIDTVHQYHFLYDGNIDIISRTKFEGIATYQYVNLGDDTLAIKFSDFRLEPGRKRKEGMHTVATGLVNEQDRLFVGPNILYKGKVIMYAESPYLVFDGFVKLDLKGALSYSEWLKYENDGETKEVKIDLSTAVSDNGTPLTTGFHFETKTKTLYPTFISKKSSQADKDFFVADKAFDFNIDSNAFVIGKMEQYLGSTKEGNFFAYNDSLSKVSVAGKFSPVTLADPKKFNFNIESAGVGQIDLNRDIFHFDLLLSTYLKVNKKVATMIANDVIEKETVKVETTVEEVETAVVETEEQKIEKEINYLQNQNYIIDTTLLNDSLALEIKDSLNLAKKNNMLKIKELKTPKAPPVVVKDSLVISNDSTSALSDSLAVTISDSLQLIEDVPTASLEIKDLSEVAKYRREEIFNQKIGSFVGNAGLEKYKLQKASGVPTPLYSINKTFSKNWTFQEVHWKWSPIFKAFYTTDHVWISNILKVEVNKEVPAFIELRKTEKGDLFTIYIEPNPNHWYFITYHDNRMAILTSNDAINKKVEGSSKGELPDRTKFFTVLAEPMEKQKFVNAYKVNYLNVSEEELLKAKEVDIENKDENPDEINIDDVVIEEEEKEFEIESQKKKKTTPSNKSKKKKGSTENYDQYQLDDSEENEERKIEEEQKEKPTIEDRKELQNDQQKMKDMFK